MENRLRKLPRDKWHTIGAIQVSRPRPHLNFWYARVNEPFVPYVRSWDDGADWKVICSLSGGGGREEERRAIELKSNRAEE